MFTECIVNVLVKHLTPLCHSLYDCLFVFSFIAVKINMEDRLGAWQKELAELSDNFKMLCRSQQNTVGMESSEVVEYVAKKHLEMLKRVN